MKNSENLTISKLQEEDKPREKLLKLGVENLTDKELLAILIRTGTKGKNVLTLAEEVLYYADNNLVELTKKGVNELAKIKGLGKTKAITLMAALELGKRKAISNFLEKKKLNNVDKAGQYLKYKYVDESVEILGIILLNRQLQIIDEAILSRGGVTATIADKRVIFKKVLQTPSVSSFILFHNHPSGSLKPSEHDIKLTKQIIEISKIMDVDFVDHIIISVEGYTSIFQYI